MRHAHHTPDSGVYPPKYHHLSILLTQLFSFASFPPHTQILPIPSKSTIRHCLLPPLHSPTVRTHLNSTFFMIGIDVGTNAVRISYNGRVGSKPLVSTVSGSKHTLSIGHLWLQITTLLQELEAGGAEKSKEKLVAKGSGDTNSEELRSGEAVNGGSAEITESPGITDWADINGSGEKPSKSHKVNKEKPAVFVAATCSMAVVEKIETESGIFYEPLDEEIIVWMDSRAKRQAKWLNEKLPQDVLARIGGHVTPELGIAKLKWVDEKYKNSGRHVVVFELYDWVSYLFAAGGMADEGLVRCLAPEALFGRGSHAMDGLVKGWSDELLEELGILVRVGALCDVGFGGGFEFGEEKSGGGVELKGALLTGAGTPGEAEAGEKVPKMDSKVKAEGKVPKTKAKAKKVKSKKSEDAKPEPPATDPEDGAIAAEALAAKSGDLSPGQTEESATQKPKNSSKPRKLKEAVEEELEEMKKPVKKKKQPKMAKAGVEKNSSGFASAESATPEPSGLKQKAPKAPKASKAQKAPKTSTDPKSSKTTKDPEASKTSKLTTPGAPDPVLRIPTARVVDPEVSSPRVLTPRVPTPRVPTPRVPTSRASKLKELNDSGAGTPKPTKAPKAVKQKKAPNLGTVTPEPSKRKSPKPKKSKAAVKPKAKEADSQEPSGSKEPVESSKLPVPEKAPKIKKPKKLSKKEKPLVKEASSTLEKPPKKEKSSKVNTSPKAKTPPKTENPPKAPKTEIPPKTSKTEGPPKTRKPKKPSKSKEHRSKYLLNFFPKAGEPIAKNRYLGGVVLHGCIDCYAGVVAQSQLSSRNETNQNDIATLDMVAGTLTCFIASIPKSTKPIEGLWGPFDQLISTPVYAFGQPATGKMFAELLSESGAAFDTLEKNLRHAEKKTRKSLTNIAKHHLYYGDRYGNRSPYGDFGMGEIVVAGHNADPRLLNLEANSLQYYCFMEFLAFQTRQLVDRVGPLDVVRVSGSQAKNKRFMRLLSEFSFCGQLRPEVRIRGGDTTVSGAIAGSIIGGDYDAAVEDEVFEAKPLLTVERDVLEKKYKFFLELSDWQHRFRHVMREKPLKREEPRSNDSLKAGASKEGNF